MQKTVQRSPGVDRLNNCLKCCLSIEKRNQIYDVGQGNGERGSAYLSEPTEELVCRFYCSSDF